MAIDGDDAHSVLARADSALYAAKAAGRNRVFHHNGLHIEAGAELESAAQHALVGAGVESRNGR
jgi:predicted signal transduction protein with EAL and GGDEF domain